VEGALAPALDALAARTRSAYVHLDVDVLDAAVAKGNALASAGGLAPGELVEAVRLVRARCGVAGAGVASYDPAYDERGEVYRAAVAALEAAVGG
jgi:arginase family enzyme